MWRRSILTLVCTLGLASLAGCGGQDGGATAEGSRVERYMIYCQKTVSCGLDAGANSVAGCFAGLENDDAWTADSIPLWKVVDGSAECVAEAADCEALKACLGEPAPVACEPPERAWCDGAVFDWCWVPENASERRRGPPQGRGRNPHC